MLCDNCDAPLDGDFCSQCGQSATNFNLPVRDFAREVASEAFSLDSRLRLTLQLLFTKPGAVSLGYVRGHRARFVPPIRLYIFASFAMFLLMTLGSGLTVSSAALGDDELFSADSVTSEPSVADANSSQSRFGERLEGRFLRGLQRMEADPEAFSQDFLSRLPQAMFFLLPAFALLLKLVYRRRLFVQHLVFAVYFHSALFLVVAVVLLPDAVGLDALSRWVPIVFITFPPYLLLAMKRFYEERWAKTLAKFFFVSATYTFVGAMAWTAILVVSLLRA